MRRISFTLAVLTALALPAHADPNGEWRVENGRAHIRVALCEGRLWGIVSWEETPGTDSENPDPSKRNRPMLGLPIILGMNPVRPNRWEGSIYNAENGKTYQASVTQRRPDVLEIEGCVLSGWVCSGEDWTRIKPAAAPPAATAAPPAPSGRRAAPPAPGAGRAAANVGAAPDTDLCLRLGIDPERAQQGWPKK
jgi:uncharacterized protein (DUF2147 family)